MKSLDNNEPAARKRDGLDSALADQIPHCGDTNPGHMGRLGNRDEQAPAYCGVSPAALERVLLDIIVQRPRGGRVSNSNEQSFEIAVRFPEQLLDRSLDFVLKDAVQLREKLLCQTSLLKSGLWRLLRLCRNVG